MLCILVDKPRLSSHREGKILAGYEWNLIESKLERAGLMRSQVEIHSISKTTSFPRSEDYARCEKELNGKDFSVILALDEIPLKFLTGKKSIRKWQLSPLDSLDKFNCKKIIPSFHPDQLRAEYHLGIYLEKAIRRAAENLAPGHWVRKETNFLLDPPHDQTIATLEALRDKPWLSVDIETGYSQINTFGLAWSERDGIAIRLLPDDLPTSAHHRIWTLIAELCESDAMKIAQNGLYERMYLSRYGIELKNFKHDTMCAMRLLYPELEKGLANVGRFYTEEPYWKDDGKVESEESGKKDWGNIRDWEKHLIYNCKDTTGTYEAAMNQRKDLEARGLLSLYDNYIVKLFDPMFEMSSRGLPMNPEIREDLVTEYETKAKEIISQLSEPINPGSSKQKIAFLQGKGMKLPINKKTKSPSADELSLKKLRLKHPEDPDLPLLLKVAKINKALSSYFRVKTFDDNRIRFSLDLFSTETGRGACRKDPWDGGFNAQTMTKYVKKMIEWPEDSDRVFVEIDLRQAESRFVAYDACEETLLGMIERGEDVHRYVAAEIYAKPMDEIVHAERQLGKKSGHGANYSMRASTFQDSCLKEMDLVIDKKMAEKTLEAYHKLFPGIRKWHKTISDTVYRERKLSNPLGLERYFYGRINDDTFREAYAYRPQSTIPMITNHLLLGLCDARTENKFNFELAAQVHDSVILSCRKKDLPSIAEFALDTSLWHPEIILPAGKLIIPTEVEVGRNLAEKIEYNPGDKI